MTCPHIPVVSYTEWNRRLFQEAENTRIPLEGILELTYRCSLHCVHCYIVDHPVKRELTFQEICLVIDQITEAGCLFLLLTGGEPLIRQDFLDIYLYAKKKGLLVTIFTNGTLLTSEIADCLAQYPPFAVEITLYGVTEETYKKITGVSGALEKCQQGIDLLLERNIHLRLKTMVSNLNQHEFLKIKEFAENLGLDFRFDPIINPRLDGTQAPRQFRLSAEEIVGLDLADAKRAGEWRDLCANFWGTPIACERYTCAAGTTYFLIDPQGQVKLCTLLPGICNLDLSRQESFLQIWKEVIPKTLAEKRNPQSICNQCQIFSICDRCAATSQVETGDPDSPIPFFCQVARLRAEAFMREEDKQKLTQKGVVYAAKEKEVP
jgi:radical SAM protein with 4Fe4S-binding SPASM domain